MGQRSIETHRFAERLGDWLRVEGPEADVVLSCRTRLARNLAGYPFVHGLSAEQATELCARVTDLLEDCRIDGQTILVEMASATPILRLLLRERHLVSRDLAPSDVRRAVQPGRAVAFGEAETTSVMVNEEDHLRLQAMAAGFSLQDAWRRVRELDRALEGHVQYSVSERLGYLTGCPTNVGTGLRASVMLHLPALGLVRSELEKVFNATQRTGLAVRGMYGEGSRAVGDLYQISNQVTLGRTEEELIADLEALVPSIVAFERKVRRVLCEEQRNALDDRVRRSMGMLKTARSMQTDMALMHLSNVRLGVCLDWVEGISPAELSRITIQVQKGHVQVLSGEDDEFVLIEPTERDRMRASFLRKRFASIS